MKYVRRILIAFAGFTLIALLTRIPALAMGQFYGLHAVLASPFDAFFIVWFMQRYGSFYPLAIGALLLGAGLSLMQPVMGFGLIVPAVITAIGAFALERMTIAPSWRAFFAALKFAGLLYPCTLIAGIISKNTTSEFSLEYALFIVAGIALAILGGLAALKTDE